MKSAIVADDSTFMRNLLKETLDGELEVVDEAGNGVEAIQKYKQHSPDIVFMDIVMPVKDGIEATEEIKKEKTGDVKVLMCTSVDQENKMKEAIKAGADGYITKPFQKPSVIEAIEEII